MGLDTLVNTPVGLSITIGAITSGITQAVKMLEGIPGLQKFRPVQAIFDFVDPAHPTRVKFFAAIVATVLNSAAIWQNGGQPLSIEAVVLDLLTFLTAVGIYGAVKPSK